MSTVPAAFSIRLSDREKEIAKSLSTNGTVAGGVHEAIELARILADNEAAEQRKKEGGADYDS